MSSSGYSVVVLRNVIELQRLAGWQECVGLELYVYVIYLFVWWKTNFIYRKGMSH